MVNDARGHNVPAAGDAPRRQALLDLSLSMNDAIPVANTTDRAQKVADLTAQGQPPSASRPLLVYRQDVQRYEFTTVASPTDTDWRVIPNRPNTDWANLTPAAPGGFASLDRDLALRLMPDGVVEVRGTYLYRNASGLPFTAGTAAAIWAANSVPSGYRPGFTVRQPGLVRLSSTAPGQAEIILNPDGSVQIVTGASGTMPASSTTGGIVIPSFRYTAGA